MSTAGPQEVPELKIREHPPSTLRNVDGVPSGGAGAKDSGAPTINAKKHRRWAPRKRGHAVLAEPAPWAGGAGYRNQGTNA
jgi:hypothetical protein